MVCNTFMNKIGSCIGYDLRDFDGENIGWKMLGNIGFTDRSFLVSKTLGQESNGL